MRKEGTGFVLTLEDLRVGENDRTETPNMQGNSDQSKSTTNHNWTEGRT